MILYEDIFLEIDRTLETKRTDFDGRFFLEIDRTLGTKRTDFEQRFFWRSIELSK